MYYFENHLRFLSVFKGYPYFLGFSTGIHLAEKNLFFLLMLDKDNF